MAYQKDWIDRLKTENKKVQYSALPYTAQPHCLAKFSVTTANSSQLNGQVGQLLSHAQKVCEHQQAKITRFILFPSPMLIFFCLFFSPVSSSSFWDFLAISARAVDSVTAG
jgi:hypothetical protein